MENTTEDEDGWGALLNQGDAGSGGESDAGGHWTGEEQGTRACERPADFPAPQGEPLSPQRTNTTVEEESNHPTEGEGHPLNGSSSGLAGKGLIGDGGALTTPGRNGGMLRAGKRNGKFSRPQKHTFTDADWTGDGEQPLPVTARGRGEVVKQALRLFLYGRMPNGKAFTVAGAVRESGASMATVWNAVSNHGILEYRRQSIIRREKARSGGDAARPEHERREIADLPTLRRRHEEAMEQVARLPIASKGYLMALRSAQATAKAIDSLLKPISKPISAPKEVVPTPSAPAPEIAGPLW